MQTDTAIFTAYEEHKHSDVAEPEKNLMRAILRTAMDDMRKRGEAYRDAKRYLMSDEDYYVFSFISVCYHLDLCPRTIRTVMGLVGNRDSIMAA